VQRLSRLLKFIAPLHRRLSLCSLSVGGRPKQSEFFCSVEHITRVE
jgi:hypothetical protein